MKKSITRAAGLLAYPAFHQALGQFVGLGTRLAVQMQFKDMRGIK